MTVFQAIVGIAREFYKFDGIPADRRRPCMLV